MNDQAIIARVHYQVGVARGATRALRAAEQAVAEGGSTQEVLAALSLLVAVEEGVGWNLDLLERPGAGEAS